MSIVASLLLSLVLLFGVWCSPAYAVTNDPDSFASRIAALADYWGDKPWEDLSSETQQFIVDRAYGRTYNGADAVNVNWYGQLLSDAIYNMTNYRDGEWVANLDVDSLGQSAVAAAATMSLDGLMAYRELIPFGRNASTNGYGDTYYPIQPMPSTVNTIVDGQVADAQAHTWTVGDPSNHENIYYNTLGSNNLSSKILGDSLLFRVPGAVAEVIERYRAAGSDVWFYFTVSSLREVGTLNGWPSLLVVPHGTFAAFSTVNPFNNKSYYRRIRNVSGASQVASFLNFSWDSSNNGYFTFSAVNSSVCAFVPYNGASVSSVYLNNTQNVPAGNQFTLESPIDVGSARQAWLIGYWPATGSSSSGVDGIPTGGSTISISHRPLSLPVPDVPVSPEPTPSVSSDIVFVDSSQNVYLTADLSNIVRLLSAINDNLVTFLGNFSSFQTWLDGLFDTFYLWVSDSWADFLSFLSRYYERFVSVINGVTLAVDDFALDVQRYYQGITSYLVRILGALDGYSPVARLSPLVDDGDSYWDWWKRLFDVLVGDLPSSVSGISSKLSELVSRFPFSLPWDVYTILGLFAHQPVPVEFDIPLPVPSGGSPVSVHVDLSPYDQVAQALRTVQLVIFGFWLVWITPKMLSVVLSAGSGLTTSKE